MPLSTRFTVRWVLLFAMVLGVGLCLISLTVLALLALRVRSAVAHLKANGIDVSEYSNTQTRPYSVSALKPLSPREWKSVHRLGGLWLFEVRHSQATSAESWQTIRQSKSTLHRLYLRDCTLNAEFLQAVNGCAQLENLVLVDVSPGSATSDFGTFPRLQEATILGKPRDADLKWLSAQPALDEITISSDAVSDELATTLLACKSLRRIDL